MSAFYRITPEEKRFLTPLPPRSQLRPHEVMKTPEEFLTLRKTHVYKEATDGWGYSVARRKDPLGNPYKTGDSTSN